MRGFLIVMLALMLGACDFAIMLAPTPNLYRATDSYPEAQVVPSLRTAEPRMFFVTDRALEGRRYGAGRSASMAFGQAAVSFGEGLDWPGLLQQSHADVSGQSVSLSVPEIRQIVRFEATPLPYARDGQDRLRHLPAARAAYEGQAAQFQAALAAKLRATGQRRLMVYVHGFNNDFDDSLTTLASLWHFSGRTSIPVAFSWPAGNGPGALGYFRDRDAATFSVHHVKEFIRMLSGIDGVDKIDIVAHSRGTELVTAALRELIIEARAAGQHPRRAWKLGILIMAAPDLGVDIVQQRLAAERFSEGFDQINLYFNPDDRALFLSSLLFRSRRVGALQMSDFQPALLAGLEREARVYFIRVDQEKRGLGHSYFRSNPAVLSDIALALRTRALPGAEQRPLVRDSVGVWALHRDYPLARRAPLSLRAQRQAEADAR